MGEISLTVSVVGSVRAVCRAAGPRAESGRGPTSCIASPHGVNGKRKPDISGKRKSDSSGVRWFPQSRCWGVGLGGAVGNWPAAATGDESAGGDCGRGRGHALRQHIPTGRTGKLRS